MKAKVVFFVFSADQGNRSPQGSQYSMARGSNNRKVFSDGLASRPSRQKRLWSRSNVCQWWSVDVSPLKSLPARLLAVRGLDPPAPWIRRSPAPQQMSEQRGDLGHPVRHSKEIRGRPIGLPTISGFWVPNPHMGRVVGYPFSPGKREEVSHC